MCDRKRIPHSKCLRVVGSLGVWFLLSTGCGSPVRAPQGFSPALKDAAREPYGGWIGVRTSARGEMLQGELIAAHQDSLHVLTQDSVLRSVGVRDIHSATLVKHQPTENAGLLAWTFLGTVSTASHGAFLIISAPMWLLIGGISTGSVSGLNSESITTRHSEPIDRHELLGKLRPYARFPNGLPPGLDRSRLHTKRTLQ